MRVKRKKPNWNYWGVMRELPLWQVICLWMDIEPDPRLCHPIPEKLLGITVSRLMAIGVEMRDIADCKRSGLFVDEFIDPDLHSLFEICASHSNSGAFPFGSTPEGIPMLMWSVDLHGFAKWAENLGQPLPKWFPRGKTKESDTTDNKERDLGGIDSAPSTGSPGDKVLQGHKNFAFEAPYVTQQFLFVIEAMKKAHIKGISDVKGLKSCVEDVFGDHPLSTRMRDEIAQVIRPDEAKKADRRSAKLRTPRSY